MRSGLWGILKRFSIVCVDERVFGSSLAVGDITCVSSGAALYQST